MLRPELPSNPPNLLRLAALLMDVIHVGRLPVASMDEALRLLKLACELAPLAQTNMDEARRRTDEVGAVWEGIRELLLTALEWERSSPPRRAFHELPEDES
jgi:hypothetical protein